MPTLSRWFLRAGFVALTLGLLLELGLAWPFPGSAASPVAALYRVAVHLLTVGWLLQVMAGVAFWMFPRHPDHPPRGNPMIGWAAFTLLNVGLALRAVGEPWSDFGGPGAILVGAAICQFTAVVLLVGLLWPRVRGPTA